ncbi:MAG TPA: nuclear transport factor 2 family protein [Anaeromyxobacteraceae bacterium]|nr:nuclear transport factor 2 family protein [Anaeromyxobacteraceae bacterium]
MKEIFEKGTDGFNNHDIDTFGGTMADGVSTRAPGGHELVGKEAVKAFFRTWVEAFPDAHLDIAALHILDDVAVEEGVFSGTQRATRMTPAGICRRPGARLASTTSSAFAGTRSPHSTSCSTAPSSLSNSGCRLRATPRPGVAAPAGRRLLPPAPDKDQLPLRLAVPWGVLSSRLAVDGVSIQVGSLKVNTGGSRMFQGLSSGMIPCLVALSVASLPATAAASGKIHEIQFALYPNPAVVRCFARSPDDPSRPPMADVKVTRGELNDRLILHIKNIKPKLAFDLFTVQRSFLSADGSPDPDFVSKFKGCFGLAWYQSDVEADDDGDGIVIVKTILLDQIFGFDPNVSLAPTNTFQVGFWSNDPSRGAPGWACPARFFGRPVFTGAASRGHAATRSPTRDAFPEET